MGISIKMKFSAVISTVAASSWPGQVWDAVEGTYTNCGTNVQIAAAAVNATCTFDFGDYQGAVKHLSIPGCFNNGAGYQCNGVEGVTNSDELDVTVFWDQAFDAATGTLDNSTCGYEEDISVSCIDNGAGARTSNVQIFGARATDTYTMQFKDNFGTIVPLLNATCDWYCDTIDTDSLASGQVTVNVNKDATSVQLFQLQIPNESEIGS